MKITKKKCLSIGIIILLSIFLAYLQFLKTGCNADDAGTYTWMYNYFELDNIEKSIKLFLNPWFYCSAITYLLNIGGSGTFSCNAYLSIWYGLAVFFTLMLTMHKREGKWILPLAVFILLPYEGTNKYHMVAAFVTLFAIWALQCYKDNGKKWILWVVALITTYTLVFTDDRMLFLVFWIAPLMIYLVILLIQDQSKRKYLYMLVFGIILAAAVLKCVDAASMRISGQGIGLMKAWGGYGGAEYYNWIDVGTFFEKGIPSLFAALFIQWNIPVQGGMVQIQSFYWIIRIIIACLALAALASGWKEIIKKGILNVEIQDSLAVICTTIVLGINILNGMVWYYDVAGAPINRYASVCWFLLAVIVARWLDEHCREGIIFHKVSYDLFLGVTFVLLCIGYIDTAFSSKEMKNSPYETELTYLKEHGELYQYGLGSHWKSNPITAATNAEYVVCPGWIENNSLTGNAADGFYTDGGNYFNYIVSDLNNVMTISPENIERIRPDFTEIFSSGDTIYGYDYDIRFDTVTVMDTAGTGYELTDPAAYNLDLPVGTSRIEITTAQKDNLLLEVADNDDIADVKIADKGDNMSTIEITCLQNTKIQLSVGRKEDITTVLYKIEIKRTAGAVNVDHQQTIIPLKAGRYIVTFAGENMKDMEVAWDVDGEVTLLHNGRIKRRYLIDISTVQNVGYEITSNGANIDRIYYENEDLFGGQVR